ncbi:MAG: type II toxin-antitoxin system VapC family toxin [Bifidobacteriaceae bacterium]|jgi:predicted nucleic acid-binding protein|nr:type II toxin-antitoxin system VapC family toxin [Bifidobacteriaceae bacterium]
MSIWYLDTSAALKLILAEPESTSLIAAINAERPSLVSSWLLETELRRAAQRSNAFDQKTATALLDRVTLHQLTPALFLQAGLLPGQFLRSLDALHLASAITIGIDAIATYDIRLAAAATELGQTVIAPGQSTEPTRQS